MNYVNLHSHTEYSNIRMLDSINTVKGLVKYTRELGMKGIAITDHECLSASMDISEINQENKKNGIDYKIAIGNEIYLTKTRDKKQKFYHLILIAKDEIGFRQLSALSSTAWYNSYYYRVLRVPTLYDELADVIGKDLGHIICSTACMAGELSSNSLNLVEARKKGLDGAEYKQNIIDFLKFLKSLFNDDLYIEIAPNATSSDQNEVNVMNVSIAKSMDIPVIFATDAHYLKKNDRLVHKAFLLSRPSEGDREVDAFYQATYIMSFDEVVEQLAPCEFQIEEIEEWASNTQKILDKIQIYDLHKKQSVVRPDVKIKDFLPGNLPVDKYPVLNRLIYSQDEQERFWSIECLYQLKKKQLYNEEYLSRLETEADVIDFVGKDFGMCLFAYFNNMSHYVDKIWDCGSIVGASRGSACCFISNWLLGITQIDSVKENLPYWRFLNKGSIGTTITTDIDIDLAPTSRDAFIATMKQEVGETNCIAVGAFGTVTSKSAVNTAARGYRSEDFPDGIDNDSAAYMSSLIPSERGFVWDLEDCFNGNEEKGRKPIRTFIEEVNKYPGLKEIMLGIEGLIDKRTRHAAGIIIQPNMIEYTPIMRAPNGELITAYSLYPLEEAGLVKIDCLVTDGCSKITQEIKLLQKYGVIQQAPLRQVYDDLLLPARIDEKDPALWDKINANEVRDLFQFNSNTGLNTIKKIKPRNITELAIANAVMRLMAPQGAETPTDRYVRMKNDISNWYKECENYHLTQEQIKILEPYYLPYSAVICMQESLMEILMDKNIAGFSLSEANAARKVVAKKRFDKINALKEQVFSAMPDQNFAQYVWETAISPQLGYSFSLPHCLGYGWIALQEAYLCLKYPQIYWETACLCVNAGTVDDVDYETPEQDCELIQFQDPDDTADDDDDKKSTVVKYGKVAKALNSLAKDGIVVTPPYINSAEKDFIPDAEHNRILYSLKAMHNVGDKETDMIIEHRPYSSFDDFVEKNNIKKNAIISLIKAGAFDEVESTNRIELMQKYILSISNQKKVLNMRNVQELFRLELLPLDKFDGQRRLFNFMKFVKNRDNKVAEDLYTIDDYCKNFILENYPDAYSLINAESQFDTKEFKKKFYDKSMLVVKNYIINNQQKLLKEVNRLAFDAEWDKYCKGTISKWEMDSISFYRHPHELAQVSHKKYLLSSFGDLPEEPEVDYFFEIKGRSIPIYKLTNIVGTAIDNDNMRHSFTILADDGSVVPIRMSNEKYAYYNKRISEFNEDGVKKVKEKGWFSSGTLLLLQGYRRGDEFVLKKYKNSMNKHTVSKILKVRGDEIDYVNNRYGMEEEEI